MIPDYLRQARVLPVIKVNDVAKSVKLAEVLANAGMTSIELTLRTSAALDCIAAIKQALPNVNIAAGTVTNAQELAQAVEAGADCIVSPGISEGLIKAATARDTLLVPGVATASEIMFGRSRGISFFKFFPAEAMGGIATVKALSAPFSDIQFCPTGGLTPENYRRYLELDSVVCVGGSWMVQPDLIEGERWREIDALVRDALS